LGISKNYLPKFQLDSLSHPIKQDTIKKNQSIFSVQKGNKKQKKKKYRYIKYKLVFFLMKHTLYIIIYMYGSHLKNRSFYRSLSKIKNNFNLWSYII